MKEFYNSFAEAVKELLGERELEKPTEEPPRKMQADRRSAPSPCLDWNCQKEMKAVRLQGSISLSRGNYRNG